MKVIRLKESDIQRMVKRVLTEQMNYTKAEEEILKFVENNYTKKIDISKITNDGMDEWLKDWIDRYNSSLSDYSSYSGGGDYYEGIRSDVSNKLSELKIELEDRGF